MFEFSEGQTMDAEWLKPYKKLDYCGGRVCFICDEAPTMIEVFLDNGYLVELGYIEEDNCYYITVTNHDYTVLEEASKVFAKVMVPGEFQTAIYRTVGLKPFESDEDNG